jgi:hypothetical protein
VRSPGRALDGPRTARSSSRPSRRLQGQEGEIGGVDGLIFGALIFVLGLLVVANAWGVIDAKLAADTAATEAVRAFVQTAQSGDPAGQARGAAMAAMESSGRNPERTSVTVSGSSLRCSRVVAEVRYRVPLVAVPLLGGFGSGLVVTATHAELVDPFRSGLAGVPSCPA